MVSKRKNKRVSQKRKSSKRRQYRSYRKYGGKKNMPTIPAPFKSSQQLQMPTIPAPFQSSQISQTEQFQSLPSVKKDKEKKGFFSRLFGNSEDDGSYSVYNPETKSTVIYNKDGTIRTELGKSFGF